MKKVFAKALAFAMAVCCLTASASAAQLGLRLLRFALVGKSSGATMEMRYAALDYLWEHLPEPLRPIIEKAQQLIPVPDVQKPEQKQERGHSWGDMSL